MKYQSENGCFFYYDRVLYSWRFAEPSLLFLLGLEAVTTFDKALTDCLQISKFYYVSSTGSLEPFEELHKIYDKIHSYLTDIGQVEDFDTFLKFNCYGLKLLLNEMTGTGDNRTVPIIFRNDSNRTAVDLSRRMNRVPDDVWPTMLIDDRRAQKIYDIFEDANYYSPSANTYSSSVGLYDRDLLKEYNARVKALNSERNYNGNIYKLLDYKAMYSYSLGVLYGCKCLGYKDSILWRVDPSIWYKGRYTNLVKTAWTVFRFHWSRLFNLCPKLLYKYQGIQPNKLWNFTNESSSTFTPIERDETFGYALSVEYKPSDDSDIWVSTLTSKPLWYSYYKGKQRCSSFTEYEKGSYLDITNSIVGEWKDVGPLVSYTNDPAVGIIVPRIDDKFTRYIAGQAITFRRSYCYTDSKYLSPLEDESVLYFTSAGFLGWVDLNTSAIAKETEEDPNILTLVPTTVESFKHAIYKKDLSVVSYYDCEVPSKKEDKRYLYGIVNSYIEDDDISTRFSGTFDVLVCDVLFDHNYIIAGEVPEGFYLTNYYDIDQVVRVYSSIIDGVIYIWDGTEQEDNKVIIDYYGYTTTPSVSLNAFICTDPYTVEAYNLRYNKDKDQDIQEDERCNYWSSSNRDELTRTCPWFKSLFDDNDNLLIGIRSGEFTLYKNIIPLTDNPIPRYVGTTSSSDKNYYFVNIEDASDLSALPNNKFIPVKEDKNYIDYDNPKSPYALGITPYRCRVIEKDDNGNSLLDQDGNALVWYDSREKLYWNGLPLVNRWQDEKPSLRNSVMYNASTDRLISIIDNEDDKLICIEDGADFITYEQFYNDYPDCGVVRNTLKVFNTSNQSDGILPCYYDNKGETDNPEISIYCVPGKTPWVARGDLLSIYGYWIVDGTTSLYDGNNEIDVVYDDDHRD